MSKSNLQEQERIDLEIQKDEKSLHAFALGETVPACHICGNTIAEGERIVVYVYRKAGEATWVFGYAKCVEHHDDCVDQFNCGFRELIADGRIGYCSDHSRQTAWPVLLHPTIRELSPASTTDSEAVAPAPWLGDTVGRSEPCDLITDEVYDQPAGIASDSPITAVNRHSTGGDSDGE